MSPGDWWPMLIVVALMVLVALTVMVLVARGVFGAHPPARRNDQQPGPPARPRHLTAKTRVSDAERQEVIDELQTHVGEGRLDLDELESRLEDALQARTVTELRHVLRELPQPTNPTRVRNT